MAATPTVLLAYPSSFYCPIGIDDVDIKTSLLVLGSYLSDYFPVTYMDFEIAVGRPNSAVQIKRFERKVREYFSDHPFDILGLSCWTSMSYRATLVVARIFRELYPDKLIVVGGYHPMARPEDFRTLDNLFDYVVTGEGETAFREIAEQFQKSGRPPKTTLVEGKTARSDQFVPYNWELIDPFVRTHFPNGMPKVYVYLSRGCPFGCSFCMESLKDRHWRPLEPEEAVEQMHTAATKYGARIVGVADACFGLRPVWRKEFLKRLTEVKPSYQTIFETRPEYLDEDDVEVLAGLNVEVQFGIESCSPDMLLLMHKTRQPDKYLQRFERLSRMLTQHRVLHRANIIFNHPGETRRTLTETFAVIDRFMEIPESYLMWVWRGYMHYPGCELDRKREYFEHTFGSQFNSPEWWREERDQYLASLESVPSSDLAGDQVELWGRMAGQREQAFKNSLATPAFRYAAEKYFPEWLNDPRYRKI